MPSKSASQHRLMEAAAHTKGGYGGVPQSVGKKFAAADKAKASGGVSYSQKPTMPVHSATNDFDAGTTTAHSPGGTPSPNTDAAGHDAGNDGTTFTGGRWTRGPHID